MEEAENGRDAPANGNAQNEENGEQEAGNEVDEEEEEGDGDEEDGDDDEEAEAPVGKPVAEDGEDDDVDTKKQKTEADSKRKSNLTHRDLVTLHFPSQNLTVVTLE